MHEYLATGLPVVSSYVDAVLEFRDEIDVVSISGGVEEWVLRLEAALAEEGVGTPSSRQAVARQNDWDSRVQILTSQLKAL